MALDPVEYSLYLCEANLMAEDAKDFKRAFDAIVDAAEHAGVEVVLVGGLARNAYVRPRMTDDIDLMVRDQAALDLLASAAAAEFLVPADVEGLAALKHRATGVDVDILVAEHAFEIEGMDQAERRRVRRRLVPVMPAEHLCAMKVDAAADPRRPEDFGDVVRLLLDGSASDETVSALVGRDLPGRVDTLAAILRVVARARAAPQRPYRRGRSR